MARVSRNGKGIRCNSHNPRFQEYDIHTVYIMYNENVYRSRNFKVLFTLEKCIFNCQKPCICRQLL